MEKSKAKGGKKIGEDSSNGKLLNEIEAISKALYLDKTNSRTLMSTVSSRSKSVGRSHFAEPKSNLKDKKEDAAQKEKKSIWGWKSLKAFTHIRNRKFNCCFSLHVHSIEGLPPSFDDVSLRVHWKRRDGELVTPIAKVLQGVAEFDEQLTHMCSVYGSRSGPHHSAKYEAKYFLLYTSVVNAPKLDLGKHRVDLTRLLPLTLEELEEEKSSGKWTTSFRLLGKANGATMNVSFAYVVIGDNFFPPASNREVVKVLSPRKNSVNAVSSVRQPSGGGNPIIVRQTGSFPVSSSVSSVSVEDIKDLHEVLPLSKLELSDSVNVLYHKLDEDKLNVSVNYEKEADVLCESIKPQALNSDTNDDKIKVEKECEIIDFSVMEHGAELSSNEPMEPKEHGADCIAVESSELKAIDSIIEVSVEEESKLQPAIFKFGSHGDESMLSECDSKKNNIYTKESLMKELETALNGASDLLRDGLDSQEDESEISNRENHLQGERNYKVSSKGRSLSLDDVAESVATEFLDMLGIEHSPFGLSSESEPESPRDRLLRQFEEETLARGGSLFDFGMDGDYTEFGLDASSGSGLDTFENLNHSSIGLASDVMPKMEFDAAMSKTRASMLEDLETEALMRQWGLNEKFFHASPPKTSNSFVSPVDLPPEDLQLPSLGGGLGPYVQTKNGGFLRSMNPALFRNSKNGGNLVMQVSSPVVVPAEMGSGITQMLQGLASVGIEKLSMQANKLMPLEDITGKSIEQIAWDTAPSLDAPKSQVLSPHRPKLEQDIPAGTKGFQGKAFGARSNKFESRSIDNEMDSEYVPLEDLAPLAMDKIEALSIEGLRIQSGMSDEDAPLNISTQSIGEFSALKGKRLNAGGSLGLEGAGGLQLLDIKDNGDDVDGLMGLSLTLDEWMRLDSGEIDDEDQISERTSKILAAHHANYTELFSGRSKGMKKRGKNNRRCGLLGNNFTIALMVQLRDPLRNYEPVGTPMLALIQVERVFMPPKPKIYSTVSELRNNSEEEDDAEPSKLDTKEVTDDKISQEEGIPLYKVTEAHVAGFKTEPGKKNLWGSTNQQQSGSRWLLASGMGKTNKHPLTKSKATSKTSSPVSSAKPADTLWSISSRVHSTGPSWRNRNIRNPNIILSNKSIRL